MKKFKFNFSFLDRFKKNTKPPTDFADENTNPNDEYDSTQTPEDFAEKTLEAFNLDKYKTELQAAKMTTSTEAAEDSSQDNIHDEHETAETHFQFEEMPLPGKPNSFQKPHFKFPTFNSGNVTNFFKNFNWDNVILCLFSPQSRLKIHSIFLIALVITVAYAIGKNSALFLTKFPTSVNVPGQIQSVPEKNSSTIQDINKIASTNLFHAKESEKAIESEAKKKDISSIVCLDADKPTALQIKLLDTIVLQDSVKSVASVQIRGNAELTNVREGEQVDRMAEVAKIVRLKMILKNLETGECEYAATEKEAGEAMPDLKIYSPKEGRALFKSSNPNIKNIGNNFKIKKTFRDSMISNISDILTQAKAVQITNPDGSLCFKMTEVAKGSLYSLLNIEENDIVCNINGKKIENLNELMNLLGRIKEIDQFQLGLKRNGMPENLEYSFE